MKNMGCITKNALGDRYDDFVKRAKDWYFRKNELHQPLDHRKSSQVLVTHLWEKPVASSIDRALNFPNKGLKLLHVKSGRPVGRPSTCSVNRANIVKLKERGKICISHQLPRPYRTPQTHANDAAGDVIHQKHGLHDERCSGATGTFTL